MAHHTSDRGAYSGGMANSAEANEGAGGRRGFKIEPKITPDIFLEAACKRLRRPSALFFYV